MWSNYPEGLAAMKFSLRLRNTLFLAVGVTIGALLSSSMVAYGFARFRFKGRDTLFMALVSTMMIPHVVTMIPTFLLFQRLNWLNTYLPLIVPAYFGNPFFIFMLRQFFLTLPPELEDAAKIDGCNPLDTWWRIILPLSKAGLVTVAIFAFMGQWNEFLGPLIYLSTDKLYSLSLGLAVFRSSYEIEWHLMLACSVVIAIPPLVLFLLAQRLIVQGMVLSGIKG
jgi:ABC-type glycerol-3-phosphate transport system permease component